MLTKDRSDLNEPDKGTLESVKVFFFVELLKLMTLTIFIMNITSYDTSSNRLIGHREWKKFDHKSCLLLRILNSFLDKLKTIFMFYDWIFNHLYDV